MADGIPRIEYVEARRVLLDAFDAMRAHLDALVLVGAQAVYLRSTGRLTGYQAFTTDADIVLDPAKLGSIPPLGKATARKSAGLEGAVVDNGPVEIAALESGDPRRVVANVAGAGALLVAKSYKLGERLAKPERLQAKDAGDVYRLFDATATDEMAAILRTLLDDERSAQATGVALDFARELFTTPGSVGVQLASQALRGSIPEATVAAVITTYMREVLEALDRCHAHPMSRTALQAD